jgi:hypothetical protein
MEERIIPLRILFLLLSYFSAVQKAVVSPSIKIGWFHGAIFGNKLLFLLFKFSALLHNL